MMQDVSYIIDCTKHLTDPTLPSPITPLEELVKAKPHPRRAAHMSNALNGLLRRKNDAGSSTTSLNGSPNLTQSEIDAPEIGDDEDALAATNSPEPNANQQGQTTENSQENAEEGQIKQDDLTDAGVADTATTVPAPEDSVTGPANSADYSQPEPESTAEGAVAQQATSQETEQASMDGKAETPQPMHPNP